MNKSVEWVNGIKAFGILAVILGHIANPLGVFIYSWHMPLFFMVAGFFIKTEANFKYLIIKDWKRLMVPYFIFATLALGITSLKILGLNRDPLNYWDELSAIIYWMDYEHMINSYAFVLWFLPALFVAKILYYIVNKLTSNIFIQFCFFVFLFVISFEFNLPFALSNAMNGVLWIFIGSILFRALNKSDRVSLRDGIGIITLLSPIVLIIVIYTYWGIPKLDMSSLVYDNKVVNFLWAVSLFLLLALFFKVIYYKKVKVFANTGWPFEQWAGATMILFILHPYTNNMAHLIVENIHFGGWPLKFLISLCMLQIILMIKKRFSDIWFFKYV